MKTPIPAAAAVATIQQTSELLQASRPTLYRMLGRGELRSVKIGRKRMITRESITDLLSRDTSR